MVAMFLSSKGKDSIVPLNANTTTVTVASTPSLQLFACCVIAFLCFSATNIRLSVFPPYATTLGLNSTKIGMLNAVFYFAAGSLSLPFGSLGDRFGAKRVAGAGLLVLAVATFVLASSTTYPGFVISHLFLGVGLGAFGPTMMSMVAEVSPAAELGRSYGWYTLALYGGMSLGPALGGLLAPPLGSTEPLFAAAIMLFVVACISQFLLTETGSKTSDSRNDREALHSFRRLLNNRPVLGCCLATVAASFSLGMFLTFFPLHAQNKGLGTNGVGAILSVQGICNALSRIPFGRLSDQVSDRRGLILFGMGGVCASMAVLGMFATNIGFVIGAIILGLSTGLAVPSIGALITESAPRILRGMTMGCFNASIFMGLMLNAMVTGPVIETAGYEAGFFQSLLITAILTCSSLLLVGRVKKYE